MQITDRDKRYLPILLIVALAISLLLFYPGCTAAGSGAVASGNRRGP